MLVGLSLSLFHPEKGQVYRGDPHDHSGPKRALSLSSSQKAKGTERASSLRRRAKTKQGTGCVELHEHRRFSLIRSVILRERESRSGPRQKKKNNILAADCASYSCSWTPRKPLRWFSLLSASPIEATTHSDRVRA